MRRGTSGHELAASSRITITNEARIERFRCDRCDRVAGFDASVCEGCGAPLGYVPEARSLRALESAAAGWFLVEGHGALWRCLNAAWGCNWMLPADAGEVWCRSCRLTRTRPDTARPDATAAWTAAEAAKRCLVHQLDRIGLPLEGRSSARPEGLVFDLVAIPGATSLTGHLRGVVTLDLAEADDLHREQLRTAFGEASRTVLGHLRHEIGHFLWPTLVDPTAQLAFRACFGDERQPYGEAVAAHYRSGGTNWDRAAYVSRYASAHPLEDWAETFAVYLAVLDAVDSAAAHGLLEFGLPTLEAVVADASPEPLLDGWRRLAPALADIARSLGATDPEATALLSTEPGAAVVAKVAFVHGRVRQLRTAPPGTSGRA